MASLRNVRLVNAGVPFFSNDAQENNYQLIWQYDWSRGKSIYFADTIMMMRGGTLKSKHHLFFRVPCLIFFSRGSRQKTLLANIEMK